MPRLRTGTFLPSITQTNPLRKGCLPLVDKGAVTVECHSARTILKVPDGRLPAAAHAWEALVNGLASRGGGDRRMPSSGKVCVLLSLLGFAPWRAVAPAPFGSDAPPAVGIRTSPIATERGPSDGTLR